MHYRQMSDGHLELRAKRYYVETIGNINEATVKISIEKSDGEAPKVKRIKAFQTAA